MTVKLDSKNFFNYFMFHPLDKQLTTPQKIICTVATIALAILTIGVAHAVCYLSLYGRVKQANQEYGPVLKVLQAHQLPPKHPLYQFYTNSRFKYDVVKHYDLGIEDDFSVLWFKPDREAKDNEFLIRINQKYAKGLATYRVKYPGFLELNDFTRFANNNIATHLVNAKEFPWMINLLREVFAYALVRDFGK